MNRTGTLLITVLVGVVLIDSAPAMYDSNTGRFLQRDPIGYAGGFNLYQYVRSSPVITLDPAGLQGYGAIGGGGITGSPLGDGLLHDLWEIISGPITPAYDFEEAKCKPIKEKWDKEIREMAELLTSLPFSTFEGGMPFKHCYWNCKMTATGGRAWAQKMSDKKEELDNIYADYGKEMKDEGCWEWLSQKDRDKIGHSARSADQPSDLQDNETGRKCAEAAMLVCVGRNHYYTSMSPLQDGKLHSLGGYCKACCTANGVGPDTPDGPLVGRGWGNRVKDFPEYDQGYVEYTH